MSLFSAFWHKTSAENRFAAQVLCIQLLKALQHETSDNVVGNPNLLSAWFCSFQLSGNIKAWVRNRTFNHIAVSFDLIWLQKSGKYSPGHVPPWILNNYLKMEPIDCPEKLKMVHSQLHITIIQDLDTCTCISRCPTCLWRWAYSFWRWHCCPTLLKSLQVKGQLNHVQLPWVLWRSCTAWRAPPKTPSMDHQWNYLSHSTLCIRSCIFTYMTNFEGMSALMLYTHVFLRSNDGGSHGLFDPSKYPRREAHHTFEILMVMFVAAI